MRSQKKSRFRPWKARPWRTLFLLVALVGPAFSGWPQSVGQKYPPAQAPASIQGLKPIGRLPASQNLRLAIGLPLRNRPRLAELLQQLYDPGSTNYHQYLTSEQFTEQFGPSVEDYQAVMDFAQSNGLELAAIHSSRILLDVRGRVSDVEKAFHITLRTYQHPSEPRTFFAPDVPPSVDASLPIIEIEGLSDYAALHPASHRKQPTGTKHGGTAAGSGPYGYYLGYDFRNAYAPGVSLNGAGQTIGLFEADGYYTNDILAYEKLSGLPEVPLQNILIDSFKGIPGTNNSEVALDIEMAISMAPGLKSVAVFEAPSTTADWLDVLDNMATNTQIKQFSSSWGYTNIVNTNASMDAVFQKMATQGQSFFQASGDGDAWVNPIWIPAASPYVTSVGGTSLSMSASGGYYAFETVWNWGNLGATNGWSLNGNGDWGSGGGTNTEYAIPSWQQGVGMAANQGSTSHRNIPDVAMTADAIWTISDNGSAESGGGTSAAAPLWAGFTALVNQQAAANGIPAVGFINPALYTIGEGLNYTNCFHDITLGNNTNGQSPTRFFAVPGYDLCTGWGTPAGQPLIDALAPEALGVTPRAGLQASGPAGGPFASSSVALVLTNKSGSNLVWTCGNTLPWLTVAPNNGTLLPGHALTIVLSLNSAATDLQAGVYWAETWFTNVSDGIVQGRESLLLANPPAMSETYSTTLLSLQPAAYWQLNETNLPPAADVVSNVGSLGFLGNGFMFNEVAQGQAGEVSNCFAFSNPALAIPYLGTYVDIPHNAGLNPTGAFTVEFWAKSRQTPTNYYCPVSSIDDSQNGNHSRFGWIFYEAAGSQWVFEIGNSNGYVATCTGGTVVTNTWQHVAGTYNGTNISLYVNGKAVSGPTNAAGFKPNANQYFTLRIGATSFGNRTFDGWVDELAVFTNALAASTVFAHYKAASTNNAGYGKQILASNPAGYWHLDEPAYSLPAQNSLPTAFNLGSLSYLGDGVYQPGSLPGVAGVPNAGFGGSNLACAFGATSCIDVPGVWLDFTGALTLSAWIKASFTSGQFQSVCSSGSGSFALMLDGLGHPHFTDGAQIFGDLVGTNLLADDQWHHLAGVYDGTNSEYLYVDGQLAAQSAAATNSPAVPGGDFWIGGDPDPGAFQFFNGVIDEVAIFTNALSAGQVLWLFSSGSNVTHLSAAVNAHSPGNIALTWVAIPGQTYSVEYCTNLVQNNWAVLGSGITATNSTMSVTNMPGAALEQFYRVVLSP